eukprot:4484478-Pyramimonas_sp.AAC.1
MAVSPETSSQHRAPTYLQVPQTPPRSLLGASWNLLGLHGASCGLLEPLRASWSLLGPPGASWALLGPPEAACLLGPPGASWGLRLPGGPWYTHRKVWQHPKMPSHL